jgi:hypothetical protein
LPHAAAGPASPISIAMATAAIASRFAIVPPSSSRPVPASLSRRSKVDTSILSNG